MLKEFPIFVQRIFKPCLKRFKEFSNFVLRIFKFGPKKFLILFKEISNFAQKNLKISPQKVQKFSSNISKFKQKIENFQFFEFIIPKYFRLNLFLNLTTENFSPIPTSNIFLQIEKTHVANPDKQCCRHKIEQFTRKACMEDIFVSHIIYPNMLSIHNSVTTQKFSSHCIWHWGELSRLSFFLCVPLLRAKQHNEF